MKQIPLTQGLFALVDDEDFDILSQWSWHIKKSKDTVYAIANGSRKLLQRKTIYMHRVILNAPEGMKVDHIDGNGINNTRSNLRICTTSENNRNHKLYRSNTSGFKGVSIDKVKMKFQATMDFNKKRIFVGYFDTAEEAARAYDKSAIKYFGEFASLNFPKEDYQ
jgi:hypothetical protein